MCVHLLVGVEQGPTGQDLFAHGAKEAPRTRDLTASLADLDLFHNVRSHTEGLKTAVLFAFAIVNHRSTPRK